MRRVCLRPSGYLKPDVGFLTIEPGNSQGARPGRSVRHDGIPDQFPLRFTFRFVGIEMSHAISFHLRGAPRSIPSRVHTGLLGLGATVGRNSARTVRRAIVSGMQMATTSLAAEKLLGLLLQAAAGLGAPFLRAGEGEQAWSRIPGRSGGSVV